MNSHSIKAAQPGSTLWDKGSPKSVKGLHLRVSNVGTKCFYLYYRTRAGQQRRPKIGDYGTISLQDAREASRLLLNRVAVGEDPKFAWDLKKAEPILDDVFDQCFESYWNTQRFIDSGWARQVKYNYENHLKSTFGRDKLSDIRPPRIASWLENYVDTPFAGNRSLETLSKLFNFATQKGLYTGLNPCSTIPAFTERKRSRYATSDEIKKVAAVLSREFENHPRSVAFIYLLMFSGARPRAIERATWSNLTIDGENGILRFHGKTSDKTGTDEVVVLPSFAMKVIDRLPRNTDTITGIRMPKEFWSKVKKEAGCEDLWARDWRRTFATIGMSSGVAMDGISEVLGHASTQTTKVYATLLPNSKLDVTNKIAEKLEELCK